MPPTKIVITKNREINQAQAASPPPLRTTYVNARFRIHKTSQTVSAATLSPLRIYIIAFSNLFYNKITRLFAFYISVFRVFAPYPHALRPLRPCDKKPPHPKPRRRSGFCGTNDPRRAKRAALVYTKHTPWCQSGEKSLVFFPEIYGEVEPALGNRSRPEAESVT